MKSGVAVVTGGASGLGKAMAEEAARRGMKVVIADVEAGAMEQVVNDLRATGTEAIGVLTDVTNAESVEALAVATEQSFGPPNLLFNNAGVASNTPASGLDDDEIAKIIDTNFKAVFQCCQSYYKMQRKSGGGCIINISSVLGIVGTSLASVYSGTKGAVISMTKALAIEWANSGFRVNAICPGFIDTDMTDMLKKRESVMAKMLEYIPLKRLGTPEDIAAPAIMLASDGAAYITGQIIVVDGGLTAM